VRPIYFSKKNKAPTIILGYIIIALIGVSPLLLVFIASWLASSHGCRLDEGGSHPCVISGNDYGETLSVMFVMGWFSLGSIPLGIAGLIAWTGKVRESLHYSRNCVRFTLNNYSVLYTDDRMFLESHINEKDTTPHLLRIFFLNKREEQKIQKDAIVTVEGLIQADNFNQALLLFNTRVIKNN
jgi:hypothetical protein